MDEGKAEQVIEHNSNQLNTDKLGIQVEGYTITNFIVEMVQYW